MEQGDEGVRIPEFVAPMRSQVEIEYGGIDDSQAQETHNINIL